MTEPQHQESGCLSRVASWRRGSHASQEGKQAAAITTGRRMEVWWAGVGQHRPQAQAWGFHSGERGHACWKSPTDSRTRGHTWVWTDGEMGGQPGVGWGTYQIWVTAFWATPGTQLCPALPAG